jgi:hypothetical protein
MALFAGCVVIAGGGVTINVALPDIVDGGQIPETTQRKRYPFNPVVTPVTSNVAVFTPEYVSELDMLTKPAPVSTCH